MLKALWFAVKVGVLIAFAVWVAERPGSVRVEWMDYIITIHMGLFLLLSFAVVLLAIFVYGVIRAFVDFPSSYSRYREIKAQEKGYKALTLGLAAVAAGDRKMAVYHAYRAEKLMPQDKGLPQLLSAQAARLDGREADAAHKFAALLENDDTAFLGVRGLLQGALDHGDYDSARQLVDKALALYPKQGWILKVALDAYIGCEDWSGARGIVKRMRKTGVVGVEQAAEDRAALYLAEAIAQEAAGFDEHAYHLMKQARKEKADFAPAVVMLVEYYMRRGQERPARSILEKAWKTAPHEVYVSLWKALFSGQDALGRLKHMARLVKLNSALALAYVEAGKAALDAGLWGDAREYFLHAEDIEPSALLYRALAELEERSVHDEQAAKDWMEKAVSAPKSKAWVCRETGRIYPEWLPIVQPRGAFNTLEWQEPAAQEYKLAADVIASADFIEAPRSY